MLEATYPIQIRGGLPVVTAPEDINFSNTDRLSKSLLEAAARGHGSFVVDMTRTQFCDSSGLNLLVRAHKRALAEGGQLRLVVPGVAVVRVFKVTGIDQVIPHFSNVDDALAGNAAINTENVFQHPTRDGHRAGFVLEPLAASGENPQTERKPHFADARVLVRSDDLGGTHG